jgi:head-tail adaptor
MGSTRVGAMHERLIIQRNDPPLLSLVSLTRATTIATATTLEPHQYVSTDWVTIAGAVLAGYNGKVKVTVTGPTTFTYAVNSTLTTPAVGPITAIYTSNAQGGQGTNFWRDLDTLWAEMMPLGAMERLQLAAVQSDVKYRFRVRVRADLSPTMRALWTPSWPPGVPPKTLAISGVPLEGDGRSYQFIEAAEVAA